MKKTVLILTLFLLASSISATGIMESDYPKEYIVTIDSVEYLIKATKVYVWERESWGSFSYEIRASLYGKVILKAKSKKAIVVMEVKE